MNRQRVVVVTTTYNEMGMIINTKAEELDLSAQPTQTNTSNALKSLDCIDRQAAIDECNKRGAEHIGYAIAHLPSAQPERLTDDDFETIRIHLSIYKEKLCNQRRWKEAEEYQKIIDRFMSFASAQSELIRCKDCKHYRQYNDQDDLCVYTMTSVEADDYCNYAERKEGESE